MAEVPAAAYDMTVIMTQIHLEAKETNDVAIGWTQCLYAVLFFELDT